MVAQHYRWDFYGLSTDSKPDATNPKVADGSTYYEADTSKLYVWYTDQWYEKEAGGGELPIASADTLGGVKVGDGLSITEAGVLSASGGGGGDTVYSNKNTSASADGGAVYIGNLDATQTEQEDPNTTDNHYRYFWALPLNNSKKPGNNTINILGGSGNIGSGGIVLGGKSCNSSSVTIGQGSSADGNAGVGVGMNATATGMSSVSLGAYSRADRQGEVNVGSTVTAFGYDNTNTRVIGGVHDGVDLTDAVTVNQISSLITAINSACGTNIVLASDGSITNVNSPE